MTGPRPPLKTDWQRGEFINHRVVNDWATRINELRAEMAVIAAGSAAAAAGGIIRLVQTITSTMVLPSAVATDYVLLLSTGAVPTMPSCVGNTNRYLLICVAGAPVNVAPSASQTLEGRPTMSLSPGSAIELISDGVSDWKVI